MTRQTFAALLGVLFAGAGFSRADAPVASYIFPAGGQRGKTVDVRVGGLYLHERCAFEMLGPGVSAGKQIQRMPTLWFEGPLLPLPASQQAEDYPKDLAGHVQIDADAPLGTRSWRVWTSQGASSGPVKFMVGDLPEIVEQEVEGDAVPVEVRLPVTINGRIFPRENVDAWSFVARKGQTITAEVYAARLGSPLDSRLEVLDPHGTRIAENDDTYGADSMIRFTAVADGTYQVRIHDVSFRGGPAYVYRLTLTADPYVDRAYPLGGRRGSTVSFELAGQGVPSGAVAIPLPAGGPADYGHRLTVNGKQTNPFFLELDDLPEYLKSEPNGKPVSVPAALNGRIARPGDTDSWAITAHKGQSYLLDLQARSLGSPLHAALSVRDAADKELARADLPGPGRVDPLIRFTAPADGTYQVRVAEAFPSRGGPAYAYRLRITDARSGDFRLRLAQDAVTLNRGGQAKLKILVEPGPMTAPIRLAVEGLPAGVTASEIQIGPGQGAAEITFKAATDAPIRAGRLTVRGTLKQGAQTVTQVATLPSPRGGAEVDSVLLAVALPTPFKVVGAYDMGWAPRGTVAHRQYRIDRGGFNGPLEIRLADRQARHLQGVTGSVITVPPGRSEVDCPIQLPPWMETGRTSRTCVMATGTVKDADGSAHTVSYTSIQPNDQIILVVEPGLLDVEAERSSYLAEPGKPVVISVRVARGKALSGPVKVELIRPAHLHGLTADPVLIAPEQSRAQVVLRLDKALQVPPTSLVTLRATVMDRGEPVLAETKVELDLKK